MPLNFALLGINNADIYIKDNKNIKFYLCGHSLGGVAASNYAYNNSNLIEGIIYLASYSNVDLTNTNLKCYSIYGSEDKVLNKEAYEKNKIYYPNLDEYIIPGGNHAQFATYGKQNGDGNSSISEEDQLNLTTNYIYQKIS